MVDPLNIQPLGPLQGPESTQGASGPKSVQGPSFAEVLKNSLEEVNKIQNQASEMQVKYITGQINNLADVMTAVEEANLAFQATMQIRTKILDAYQELSRMQV